MIFIYYLFYNRTYVFFIILRSGQDRGEEYLSYELERKQRYIYMYYI